MLPGPSSSFSSSTSCSASSSMEKNQFLADSKDISTSNSEKLLALPSSQSSHHHPRNRLRRRRYSPLTNHDGIADDSNQQQQHKQTKAQTSVQQQTTHSSTRTFNSYNNNNKRDQNDEDVDDDLEQVAQRIRAELCYTEILELAMEAERAAEAGQEHFAGQPSTFLSGTNTSSSVAQGTMSRHSNDALLQPDRLPRPRLTMRAKTFAGLERIRPFQSASSLAATDRLKKVNVLTLRPANDVFPCFEAFHNHLRAHLMRSQVDKQTLLYYPHGLQKSHEPTQQSVLHNRLDALSQSFSFDRWVHSNSLSSNDGEAEYANTLADHLIRNPKKHANYGARQNTRKIEPLPDLEIPGDYFLSSRPVGVVDDPDPFMPPHSPARSTYSRSEHASPRALLDQVQDDEDEDSGPGEEAATRESNEIMTLMPQTPPPPAYYRKDLNQTKEIGTLTVAQETDANSLVHDDPSLSPGNSIQEYHDVEFRTPTTSKAVKEVGPSFVTPARLRNIRGLETRGQSVELSPPALEHLMLGSIPLHSSHSVPGAWPEILPESSSRPHSGCAGPTASSIAANARGISAQCDPSVLLPPTYPGRGICADMEAQSVPSDRNVQNQTSCTSSFGPSRRYSIASESNSILNESFPNPEDVSLDALQDSPVTANCSCLSLSPVGSSIEGSSSVNPLSTTLAEKLALPHSLETKKPDYNLRRSFSADAMPNIQWGDLNFPSSRRGSDKRAAPESAVQRILSRFSPKRNSKAIRVSRRENDDFLHNYLYCSKASEYRTDQPHTSQHESIGCDANSWLCAPFFPDSDLGDFFRHPHMTRSNSNGLSLGRDAWPATRIEPESWFDMASEHLDGMLTKFAGQAARRDNHWNVAFQAPILKVSSAQRSFARKSPGNNDDMSEWREEKKTDDVAASTTGRFVVPERSNDSVKGLGRRSKLESDEHSQVYQSSSPRRMSTTGRRESGMAKIVVNPTF